MPIDVSSTFPLARRYAESFLSLAQTSGDVAAVEGDMMTLAAMITESKDLQTILDSPIISAIKKANIFVEIAKQAGFCDMTQRFLHVLFIAGRGSILEAVIAAFTSTLAVQRGETLARVQSAILLTATQIKALAKALSATRVETSVDEGLLGGLVITMGSMRLDDSLKGKLTRLGNTIQGNRSAA